MLVVAQASRVRQAQRPRDVVVALATDRDRHVLLAADRVGDRRRADRRGHQRRLPEGRTRLGVLRLEEALAVLGVALPSQPMNVMPLAVFIEPL